MAKRVLLVFSSPIVRDPIIGETILKTGAVFNILQTQITSMGGGEVVGEIIADDDKAGEFIRILKRRGVRVKEVESLVSFNKDECVDCGLCVSICPTGAITFTEEFSVNVDIKKCILCQMCIKNCPVRALKYLGE